MKAKERVLYDNYDFDDYKESAIYNLKLNGIEDPSEDEVFDEACFINEMDWADFKRDLINIFSNGNHFIAVGTCGIWQGNFAGGFIFSDYNELARTLFKDCDYFKFWDENGHFFIQCSHHDGTHLVEVRELTEKGYSYYDNWNYSWNDRRSEREVHKRMFMDSHYSKLMHVAHKLYGYKKVEYEKEAA